MILTVFAIAAAAAIAHLGLRSMIFLVSHGVASSNLSLGSIRACIVGLKGVGAIVLGLLLLSFNRLTPLCAFFALVLSCGSELSCHLGLRTTAAFSTSDGVSQRLFNLSFLAIIACTILAYGMQWIGLNPVPNTVPLVFQRAASHWTMQALGLLGIFLFARNLWILMRHSRTLCHLLKSYSEALKKGKLKRVW